MRIFLSMIIIVFCTIAIIDSVVFSETVYMYESEKLNLETYYEDHELVLYVYRSFEDFSWPTELTLSEQHHLDDVRTVWMYGTVLFFLLLILFVISIIAIPGSDVILRSAVKISGYVLILIPLIFAMIPFGKMFTYFHHILFPQGNWMFPADSYLLQMYPYQFFVDYAIFIGVGMVLSGIILLVFSYFIRRTVVTKLFSLLHKSL